MTQGRLDLPPMRERTPWDIWRWRLIHAAAQAKTRVELAELYEHLARHGPVPNEAARGFWLMAAETCRNGEGAYATIPAAAVARPETAAVVAPAPAPWTDRGPAPDPAPAPAAAIPVETEQTDEEWF